MSEQDALILARIVKRLLEQTLYGAEDPRGLKFGEAYQALQDVRAIIERLEADTEAGA